MTKKDYEKFAELIRNMDADNIFNSTDIARDEFVRRMKNLFARDNCKFNRYKFQRACDGEREES